MTLRKLFSLRDSACQIATLRIPNVAFTAAQSGLSNANANWIMQGHLSNDFRSGEKDISAQVAFGKNAPVPYGAMCGLP
jgi:hypothetical protein